MAQRTLVCRIAAGAIGNESGGVGKAGTGVRSGALRHAHQKSLITSKATSWPACALVSPGRTGPVRITPHALRSTSGRVTRRKQSTRQIRPSGVSRPALVNPNPLKRLMTRSVSFAVAT